MIRRRHVVSGVRLGWGRGASKACRERLSVAEVAKCYTAEIARDHAIAKGLNLQPQ